MCLLSDFTRFGSSRSTPGEAGSFTDSVEGEDNRQELIDLADTIPLLKIFDLYKIYCNQYIRSIRCPFKSHKGGRENSSSFFYYHETNSFNCFGCKQGGPFAHATHFVAAMENISLEKSANKIIDLFKDDLGDVGEKLTSQNDDEKLNIMLDFSNSVREFYQTYNSTEAMIYIEKACQQYDKLYNSVHKDNYALNQLVQQLKEYILLYE
jgi:hypothetical protein